MLPPAVVLSTTLHTLSGYLPGAFRVEVVITMPGVYGTLRCWAVVTAGTARRARRHRERVILEDTVTAAWLPAPSVAWGQPPDRIQSGG